MHETMIEIYEFSKYFLLHVSSLNPFESPRLSKKSLTLKPHNFLEYFIKKYIYIHIHIGHIQISFMQSLTNKNK